MLLSLLAFPFFLSLLAPLVEAAQDVTELNISDRLPLSIFTYKRNTPHYIVILTRRFCRRHFKFGVKLPPQQILQIDD